MTTGQQARRPVSALHGHPFHPVLVTVPIGSWVAALVFDIASHVVREPAFLTRGPVWLIAIAVATVVLVLLATSAG